MDSPLPTVIFGMAKSCDDYEGSKEQKIRLDILQMIHAANSLIAVDLCAKAICYMALPYQNTRKKKIKNQKEIICDYDMGYFVSKWARDYNYNSDNITVSAMFFDDKITIEQKLMIQNEKDNNVLSTQLYATDGDKLGAKMTESKKIIEENMIDGITKIHSSVVVNANKGGKYEDIFERVKYIRWDFVGVIE